MTRALSVLVVLAVLLGACAGVLGLRASDPSHPFEHRAHVSNGIRCTQCHRGLDEPSDARLHLPSTQDCRSCHAKPHDERACAGCHGEAHVRGAAELAARRLRFDHRAHTEAVHGDCVRCHASVAEARPEALLPKMATCFGCHEHRDQWARRDCDGCHVDLTRDDVPPESHLVHEGDWLREHGTHAGSERDLCASCHTERSCAACHGAGTVPALPARLAFDDVKLSGLHRGGFLARHPEEARADPGLCTTCHTETSCVDCHTRAKVAPGTTTTNPHPIGWVSTAAGGGDHGVQARIDPASCAGCHGGAGEQLCVGCHKVGGPGGNPHGPGFVSTKIKTHDAPCRLCHGTGP